MKNSIIYGGVTAVANAILSLISFLLGYQTIKYGHGIWAGLLAFVVPIGILYLGMREARASHPNKAEGYPYSKAVLAALTISVFAGLFTAPYVFVHSTYINPDMPQYAADYSRAKMESQGKPEAQIETAIKVQKAMMSPVAQTILTLLFAPIIGTIEGLILAIFIKRPAPADEVQAV